MKIIDFIPSSKETEICVPAPKPSFHYLPDFYKKYHQDEKPYVFDQYGQIDNKSAKRCMPFFDSFNMGYIQETWCDIYIENNDEQVNYYYPVSPRIMDSRDNISFRNMIVGNEFYPIEFLWKMEWIPKMPKGYSLLITHPLNRTDLPFQTLSGIIDSDAFYHSPSGGLPFYLKNNFSGIIKAGTPMYQIIPIKRDNWKKNENNFNMNNIVKNNFKIRKSFISAYKNLFWNKKEYM